MCGAKPKRPSTLSTATDLDMQRLAVIPARGGSKRLPGKNIRPLHGRPLITWVIEAALASGCFTRVLVTTDDEGIARTAREAGAWVPFQRPAELSSDIASSVDVLVHAVKTVQQMPAEVGGFFPALTALLQPTSPFTRPEHVREAIQTFEGAQFVTLSSMCPVRERPEWMFHVEPAGAASPLDPVRLTDPASSFPPLYRENGAIYLVQTAYLLREERLYQVEKHGAYLMSIRDSVDIDTADDWAVAETLNVFKNTGDNGVLRVSGGIQGNP
ncbi:MAG: acylneuraminate cytidylyltransferase family protein [Candidatus Ozemobacteraceae bacterium]